MANIANKSIIASVLISIISLVVLSMGAASLVLMSDANPIHLLKLFVLNKNTNVKIKTRKPNAGTP